MRSIRAPRQSCRWVFTLNNYNDDDQTNLRIFSDDPVVKYLVFGREVSPTTSTPHLQGFVTFSLKQSLASLRRRNVFARAHLEVAGGPSPVAAEYCKKDGDFEEFGLIPTPGKTNRYDDFRDWVISQPTKPSLAQVACEFPSIFMQSGRVQTFIDLVFPYKIPVSGEYRPYQQALADELDHLFPSPRRVTFIVDPVGNAGKSWFVDRYFAANPDRVQILSVGRREDLSFAVDERKSVFLFDLPRSSSEFLPYTLLEQLKDGRIFSNKYESRMKRVMFAHVVVFMNEYPDMTKLSQDRYSITEWSNAIIRDN